MPATRRLFRSQGVMFSDAYSTTPLCCPARASIMTGQYVHNHGVKYFNSYDLDQSDTLQRYLSEAGYRTAYFGKYLNRWDLEKDPPHFDAWGAFPQSTARTYVGGEWNVDGEVREIGVYATHFLERLAEDFLEDSNSRDDSKPWLMFVSVPAPHVPLIPEKRYADAPVRRWNGNPAVFDDTSDKPNYVQAREEKACDLSCAKRIRIGQYRTLYSVDDLIDRLFHKMDGLGETDNTLAFFLSDNGANWGEYGLSGKRYPYTPSIKVPLLIRWPSRLEPHTDRRLAANIDIAPTILDAADVSLPRRERMDGRSLLKDWTRPRILLEHWHVQGVPQWASIRRKSFQYVEYGGRVRAPKREYYDLRADPWQLRNLLTEGNGEGPSDKRLARLHRLLLLDQQCTGGGCP